MTSYVASKDVSISLNNTSPIQIREISSNTPNLYKRKSYSSSASLPHKMIKTHEESNTDQAQINLLFYKIFSLCKEIKKDQSKSSKLITLDPLFSEENLNQILNPLFTRTLLKHTQKKGIRSSLEQDACCGDYWKELHVKSNSMLSLQDLQKLYFCLEAPSLDQRLQGLIPVKTKQGFKDMTTNSTHSLHPVNPSISMRNRLGLTIPLNGKFYHFNIYYKKSDSAKEEEIASSCLNPCKNDFQYLLCCQIKEPCKTINISNFIAKSICEIQNDQGLIKSVTGFSLAGSQCSMVFQNLLKKMNSIRDKALNQKDTLSSSFIKIFLEDTQIRKRKIAEQSPQNLHIENLKKLKACDKEEAIGLDRLGNNCCINATLQIILNNSELRKIWENCFPEIAIMYYEALHNGQASAPNAISYKFRKRLVQKSSSNLIDQSLFTQEDPTAFLEAFFNICKERLDLSHLEIHFEKMKYKQVGDGKTEPSIEQPENHKHFRISINNQFDRKTSLEELLRKHCLEINEIEENGVNVRYISEDQYVSLPNHLIIDLFTNNREDASDVCIPINLHFPQDLLKERSTHTYELEGFIVHLGETDKSGHYIAYRKVKNRWKKFDDSQVTDVDENQLQQLLGNFQGEELKYSNPYDAFQKESECQQTDNHTLKEQSSFLYKLLGTVKSTAKYFFKEDSNPYVCMLSYSKNQP